MNHPNPDYKMTMNRRTQPTRGSGAVWGEWLQCVGIGYGVRGMVAVWEGEVEVGEGVVAVWEWLRCGRE